MEQMALRKRIVFRLVLKILWYASIPTLSVYFSLVLGFWLSSFA